MKKNSEKIVEDQARKAGWSTIVDRNFSKMVYFLGPWMDDGQRLRFDLMAVQSFGSWYRRGKG